VISNGQYRAVADWSGDGLATVVIEEDGTDAYELIVEPMELPDDG
jgi:hypothetical protein